MTDNKNKRNYWGVKHNEVIVKDGTFQQCWDFFVLMGGDIPVSKLVADGYRIARIK